MKCVTSFFLAETHFRKIWEIPGFAIFEICHLNAGPLFAVGPDDFNQVRNRARWSVFGTWEQAYYVATDKCWQELPREVCAFLEEIE
jgi:hypothetical protein